ncbi:MAG: hypothetical protein ACE5F9_10460 [Phycisphaerae bacterium]
MKAERRQELRTNQLSEQIVQVKTFINDHRVLLSAFILGAIVLVAGSVWYSNNRENLVADGWRDYTAVATPPADDADALGTGEKIDRLTELAERNIEPALTLTAWMAIGEAARNQFVSPPADDAEAGVAEERDWLDISQRAYEHVLHDFPDHVSTIGAAMIALGALAEDASDIDRSKEWYQKVIDDARFADTALVDQAKYRLEGLDTWSEPVVFAPPLVGPVAPEAASAFPGMTPSLPPIPSDSQLPEALRAIAPSATNNAPDATPPSSDAGSAADAGTPSPADSAGASTESGKPAATPKPAEKPPVNKDAPPPKAP